MLKMGRRHVPRKWDRQQLASDVSIEGKKKDMRSTVIDEEKKQNLELEDEDKGKEKTAVRVIEGASVLNEHKLKDKKSQQVVTKKKGFGKEEKESERKMLQVVQLYRGCTDTVKITLSNNDSSTVCFVERHLALVSLIHLATFRRTQLCCFCN